MYMHVPHCLYCSTYVHISHCRLNQEVDVPDNGPVDGPCEASERSFQLGPADKPTSCAVSCKEKNKTMDELFDWQHITSPLEEEEVDVSLMSVLLGIDWLGCIHINIHTSVHVYWYSVLSLLLVVTSVLNIIIYVHNIHVRTTYICIGALALQNIVYWCMCVHRFTLCGTLYTYIYTGQHVDGS